MLDITQWTVPSLKSVSHYYLFNSIANAKENFMSSIAELVPEEKINQEEIQGRVIKVIHEQIDIEKNKIHLHSHLINDLGADSLDTVELVMAFEEEFELDIPDEVAEKINTVQSVVELVLSKIN